MISRIDHIAVAVQDFDEAEHFFRDLLGGIPGSQGKNRDLKFFWKMFSLGDLSRIELLTPTGEGSFLEGFFKRRGNGGVHHITLQTPSISATQTFLEQQGIPYFGYQEYGEQWKELFIHPKDAFGVLIQIAEFSADEWLDDSVNVAKGKKWQIGRFGDGFRLQLAHPGGGKVTLDLKREDLTRLVNDLQEALQSG